MGVRAMSQPFNVDDLLGMEDRLVAMKVILSGVFDKELAELKKLKQEISVKQGTLDTVEKANKYKLDMEQSVESIKKESEKIRENAAKKQSEADNRLTKAEAKEKYITQDLVSREEELKKNLEAFENKKKALDIEFENKNSDLKEREGFLNQGKIYLATETAAFEEREKAFQSKVDAIMGK